MMEIKPYPDTVTILADEYKGLIQTQDRVNTVLNLYRLVPSVDYRELSMILTGKEWD